MKKYKIYLIHGYMSSPEANWFPYLKKELECENVEVSILRIPNSKHPKFNEWIDHLDNTIKDYNEKTLFIGHSLGCVTLLNFLAKRSSKKIKGLFLISGFIEDCPIPEILEFVKPTINYETITKLTKHRTVISAKNDIVISFKYSQILAEKIDSEFILLNEGKHFTCKDNVTEFPFLVDKIKTLLD